MSSPYLTGPYRLSSCHSERPPVVINRRAALHMLIRISFVLLPLLVEFDPDSVIHAVVVV
jgi:hypothetical protein